MRDNLFSNLLPLRDEWAEAENLFSTSADADKLFEFIECTALCLDALERVRRAVTSRVLAENWSECISEFKDCWERFLVVHSYFKEVPCETPIKIHNILVEIPLFIKLTKKSLFDYSEQGFESVHHCYKTLEQRYKIRSVQTSKNETISKRKNDKNRKENVSSKKSKKEKFEEKQEKLMGSDVVKFLFEKIESRLCEEDSGDVVECIRKQRMHCLNAFNAKSFSGDCNDRLLRSKKLKFCSHIKNYI